MAQSNTSRAHKQLLEGKRLRLTSLLHPATGQEIEDIRRPASISSSPRAPAPAQASAPTRKAAGKPLGMARPTVVLLPASPTIKRPMSRPVFLPQPQPLPAGYTPAVKPADFLRWMAKREQSDWRRQVQPTKVLAIGFCISTVILGFSGGASFSSERQGGAEAVVAQAMVSPFSRIDPAPAIAPAPQAVRTAPMAAVAPRPKRGVIIEPLAPKYADDATLHVRITEAVVLTPHKGVRKKVRGKRNKAIAARRHRR